MYIKFYFVKNIIFMIFLQVGIFVKSPTNTGDAIKIWIEFIFIIL